MYLVFYVPVSLLFTRILFFDFFQLVPRDWPKNPDLDKWQFSFNLVTYFFFFLTCFLKVTYSSDSFLQQFALWFVIIHYFQHTTSTSKHVVNK